MPAMNFTADAATDRLTIAGHGLNTGDGPAAVITIGGALPAGLVPASDYWIIRLDDNTIQLATSNSAALAGTAVNFTDNGIGTQTLGIGLPYRRPRTYAKGSQVWSIDFNAVFDVLIALWAFLTGQLQTLWNGMKLAGSLAVGGQPLTFANLTYTAAVSDLITAVAHGLSTCDGPVQTSSTGVLPGGLAPTTSYWAIVVDANSFKLATSFANALAGIPVDITSTGSGAHTLLCLSSTTRPADATVSRTLTVNGPIAATGGLVAAGPVTANAGVVAATNQHVVVSGTGLLKHGKRTLKIPLFQAGTSGLLLFSNTFPVLLTGLIVGTRILGVSARARDNASLTLHFFSLSDGVASSDIAVSSPSSGSASFKQLAITGLTTMVTAAVEYAISITCSPAGGATSALSALEVDYDQP